MATIRTAIQIQDSMSPAFRAMNNAMNIVISSFETLQNVSGNAVNTNSIQAVRRELGNASVAIDQIEDNIRNSNNQQQQFNNSLRSGQGAADGLLGKIKGVVGAYIGLRTAGGVANISDNLVQTKARLNMMNDNLQTTEQLQQMIFQSAQRSRASYSSTADAVSKLGIRAKDAFANNTEVVAFTEQLNKMFVIAGASQEEMSSATLQLTQALGSGILRGEEFNAVFEAAPNIMQAVADYIEVPIGNLKEMASEGEITADIVKNAMFAAANETNAKFETMPMTISQIWTRIKNNALQEFEPVLLKINEIANNPNFDIMVSNISNSMATLANIVLSTIDIIANVSSTIADNWGTIGPVVWAVIGAYVAFNTIALITNGILGIMTFMESMSAASKALHAGASLTQAAATQTATGAQVGLNIALLACPLTWIIIIIIAVIAALVAWAAHTNGLKATWLMFTNALITSFEIAKLSAYQMVYGIMNGFDSMCIGVQAATIGIQNALGNMKAGGLMIIQNFVNGAIDLINSLISFVNNIPGVSIDAISHVTFGAEAMALNEAEKSARLSEFKGYATEKNKGIQDRKNKINDMANEIVANMAERKANIEAAKASHANGKGESILDKAKGALNMDDLLANSNIPDYGGMLDNIGSGVGSTAGNTGAIKDSLDVAEEDLKYLRDLAEQEVINRFTGIDIKVDMGGVNNNVSSNVDLDGMVAYLEETLTETMESCAEGVH